MLAGLAIDYSYTHLTHVLEHPLSALNPDLPHGLGLAILLPAVVKETYPAVPEILAEIYEPIVPGLKGVPGEAEKLACGIKDWLKDMGIKERLVDVGFDESQVERLTDLAMSTPLLSQMLSQAPVKVDRELVKRIYLNSLR
jgi:alcohol dehydrogenase class IV